MNMFGGAVDNRLHALHIGLPRAIRAAVGVGDTDAEHNALITKITFSHSLEPPRWQNKHLAEQDDDDPKKHRPL